MDVGITYLGDLTFVDKPIHVVSTGEDPDDFCMAFYTEPGGDTVTENHRASLIAHAAARRDEEVPIIMGDALLAVEPALADKIVENDLERQRDKESVKAFREWMLSYSEMTGGDPADVFAAVVSYAAHVAHETMEAARLDHAQQIASMLGLDTEQVGVFFV